MAIEVAELRRLLAEAGDAGGERLLEVPEERLGLGDAFRPLFPDGVMRARATRIDSDALSFSGTVETTWAEQPASVQMTFSHDGGSEVEGVTVAAELPGEGAQAQALAAELGLRVVDLPGMAGASRLVLRQADGTLSVSGEGKGGRWTAVCREDTGRLWVGRGADGWLVAGGDRALSGEQVAALAAAAGEDVPTAAGGVGEGCWLLMPGADGAAAGPAARGWGAAAEGHGVLGDEPVWVPVRGKPQTRELDLKRRDGLGRPMPVRPDGSGTDRGNGIAMPGARAADASYAVATDDGFVVLAPGALARHSRRLRVAGASALVPTSRSFIDFGDLADGKSKTVTYNKPPLYVSGGLVARDAQPPYELVVGGVLVVDTKSFTGSAVAAAYVPTSGNRTSFFAFGALTPQKAVGPPAFQVRGVAGGMGWRSKLREPGVEELSDFPFLRALDDPRAIGANPDGSADPLAVLDTLTGGDTPWITPAGSGEDPLWIVAGLGFTICERLDGSAMLLLQTGADLTFGLLGTAAMCFPKEAGRRRYANVEVALQAVLKPNAGELTLAAQLTPNSFLLDPNCSLRGGVAFKTWFGPSPNRGDFVVTIGGYHRNYTPPSHYPAVPRLGFDWDLSGKVTVSGEAYFALTPAAVMAGGALEVRFHSGALRAWLDARVDALIQWKPFYFDVGLRVSVGVQARIKVWFVKITITVEVGVDLRLWGPPTGGEAKIKLWFISFTIGFGRDRDPDDKALDWAGFRSMLPPPESTVRILPGAGLISDAQQPDGTRSQDSRWQVATSGFTFSTDSAMPVSELYLAESGGTKAETGSKVNIRPMQRTDLTSVHRVWVTNDSTALCMNAWTWTASKAAVPQALWGKGAGNALPAPGDQLVDNQLTGVTLTSPGPSNGTDTGYIGEDALAFDPIDPDGTQPLDPSAGKTGPTPTRPGGVIAAIATTVNASAQKTARAQLAQALSGFGIDVGTPDTDFSAYARAAETAFTAEPMLMTT
ncbi:DUF6603 domain-containing protein [Streptomyces sp. NPDC090442]|uniref:DUF6603 domain-containing protein n=1 Tax=Streptomyces sp. NPDC090442 TaxID=3365962 RepID=UPI003826AF7A